MKRNTLDMADMQNNIKDLTETKKQMEQDMNSVKENLAELVNQKVQEALQQNRSKPPHRRFWQKGKTKQGKQNWIL